MKLKIILAVSLVINSILIIVLFTYRNQEDDVIVEFNPFHNNYNITYNQLLKQGYERVPEDVPLLGKQKGNLYIYYQFSGINNENKAFWRNARIYLNMKEVDTMKVYQIISAYDADIIYPNQLNSNNRIVDKQISLFNPFFVQHRYNKQIFECHLSNSIDEGGYVINITQAFPVTDPELLEIERDFYKHNTRFGKDTLVLEDGSKIISTYENWIKYEEVDLDSKGNIKRISTTQSVKEYYPSGQIKSNTIGNKETGQNTWWYENGKIWAMINYVDGKRYGACKEYYENGQLKMSGSYNGGNYETAGDEDQGIKHGEWKYYSSGGKLDSTLYYQNDTLIKKINNSR